MLAFDRDNTLTFAETISGTGSVSQIGPGTTDLTVLNTYTGGTTVSDGRLALSMGATLGGDAGKRR